MKIYSIILFLVILMPCHAQNSYANLIKSDTDIRWAATYKQVFNINHNNDTDQYTINQILYYKGAKLYVKNLSVESKLTKDSLWNKIASSCSPCNIDSSDLLTPELKSKCIDLGNEEALYDLKYDTSNDSTLSVKVITLKDPIFSHPLFKDMLKSRITAITFKGRRILPQKIINYGNLKIECPQFDCGCYGCTCAPITVWEEVNIDSFYKYIISQHFYFDTVKNILYSQVNHITLYKQLYTTSGVYIGEIPFYKIYFIKPSSPFRKKTKKVLK